MNLDQADAKVDENAFPWHLRLFRSEVDGTHFAI